MTSVLCLPVAEQYPSNTATSDESTSTRISVTDMSSGLLEVVSQVLNGFNARIRRYSLMNLGDCRIWNA